MSAVAARAVTPAALPSRALVATTVVLAAVAATALAQLGTKGLIVIFGSLVIAAGLALFRDRRLFVLLLMVASYQFLFHKSIGPINTESSGGAPSIYITSIDALLLLLYVIWALDGTLMRDLRENLGRPIFVIPVIAMISTLPSFLIARDIHASFSELVRMVWMFMLFIYVALRVRDVRDARLVVLTMFVIALVQCAVVVLQWRTGSSLGLGFLGEESTLGVRTLDSGTDIPRPTGTVVHPDFLAALVAPIGLVAYSLGVALRTRLRWICLAAVPIAAAPLVLSQTRAALVGFGVGFAALTLWYLLTKRLQMRTVVLAVVAALLLSLPFWGEIKTRVIDNFGTDQFQLEVQSRLELNDIAVAMSLDHPLFGVGLNNFVQTMDDYDTYGLIFAGNPVHDIYLLVFTETGLVGFLGFVASIAMMVYVALRAARARDPQLAAIGAGITASLLFFGAEEVLTFSVRQDMPLALLWLLVGLAAACVRIDRAGAPEPAMVAAAAEAVPA